MDLRSSLNVTFYHTDDELITSAVILLQRVVRGYLTRKKLEEAKEIFESLFSDVENENQDFQIRWEHNDNVCWPIPSLNFQPKPPESYHADRSSRYSESKKLIANSSSVPQHVSKSIDCIDSLLDEIASLNCFEKGSQPLGPKVCSSQPTFGTTKSNLTEGSRSTPSLIRQHCTTDSVSLNHNYQQLHGQCKLCRKLQTEAYRHNEPRMCNQSLRSKCTRSDIWRPLGVPAKKVDGTMFRQTGCYKGQHDDVDDLRERIWSYSSMVRQKMKLKTAKQARSPSTKHMPTKSLRHWPKSGIRQSSPTQMTSTTPQDGSLSPASPESPIVPSLQSPPRVPGNVRECAVQIGESLMFPNSVDATVQTISDRGVQTDDILPSKDDDWPTVPQPTNEIEDVGVQSKKSMTNMEEMSATDHVSLSSSPSPARNSTEVDVHITSVTPLNSTSLLDATQTFIPSQKDSSTPMAAAKELVSTEVHTSIANPVTDETSVWAESPSHPAEVKKDLTQKELEAMKENMSMELLWIEQAIASRKQYLSLVKTMKGDQMESC